MRFLAERSGGVPSEVTTKGGRHHVKKGGGLCWGTGGEKCKAYLLEVMTGERRGRERRRVYLYAYLISEQKDAPNITA